MSTKKTSEETQLDFFFWLGEDGHVESLTKEELEKKQKDWPGARP